MHAVRRTAQALREEYRVPAPTPNRLPLDSETEMYDGLGYVVQSCVVVTRVPAQPLKRDIDCDALVLGDVPWPAR